MIISVPTLQFQVMNETFIIIYSICLYIIFKKKEKRARDFIRFGKRGDEDMEDTFANDKAQTMQFPYKRFGRRRMSNFLRFG